jgi:hypothetical protein
LQPTKNPILAQHPLPLPTIATNKRHQVHHRQRKGALISGLVELLLIGVEEAE